jgi:hypothetical protein
MDHPKINQIKTILNIIDIHNTNIAISIDIAENIPIGVITIALLRYNLSLNRPAIIPPIYTLNPNAEAISPLIRAYGVCVYRYNGNQNREL